MRAEAGVLAVSVALLSAGCAVGPTTRGRRLPVPPDYKERLGPEAAAESWKAAEPRDEALRGKWWEVFAEPELNELEDEVGSSNQSIAQAEAAFRGARAAVREARAGAVSHGDRLPVGQPRASVAEQLDRARRHVGRHDYELPVADRPLLRGGCVGAHPPQRGRQRRERPGERGRSRDSPGSACRRSWRSTTSSSGPRRPEAAPRRDGGRLREGAAAHDQPPRPGRRLRRATSPRPQTQLDTTRAQATDLAVTRAQLEHAIAILIGKPPGDLTSPWPRAPTSRRRFRSAFRRAPGAAAGHRGRRAPGGRGKRPDRRRQGGVLPVPPAVGLRRIRRHEGRELPLPGQPLLGGRPVAGRDNLRRRAATRDPGAGASAPTTPPWPATVRPC